MTRTTIRPAGLQDAAALAALKAEWATGGAVPSSEADAASAAMAAFLRRQGDAAVCRIAEEDGRPVGAAWLIVFERVPSLGQDRRTSADVQSVYVSPSARGRGVGAALVAALLEEADRRGIPRITVHSSSGATRLYERAGFVVSADLLQRERG